MPEWWLIVSALFFIASFLLNVALIVGGWIAWKRIGPVLEELKGQVQRVGEKTEAIATTAKSTMDNVQRKTVQILGAAEESSARVTQKIGAASTALTALFVAARIIGFMRGMARNPRDGAPARARGSKSFASPRRK